MVYTKYKFTPQDIAGYILIEDLPHRRQNEIIYDLFHNHNSSVVHPFCKMYSQLKAAVSDLLIQYDLDINTLNEAELILLELTKTGLNIRDNNADYFGAYFKLIKLQLMYSGITYRKIKLRTLLKDFGYKRRTAALIDSMNRTLHALGLSSYLKNREPCNLRDINIDDMVIIRLF